MILKNLLLFLSAARQMMLIHPIHFFKNYRFKDRRRSLKKILTNNLSIITIRVLLKL